MKANRVEIAGLRLDRGSFRLGPIDVEVAAGGSLGIIGPSGSGKTTLLRCIAGLERAGAGTIRIGDQVVQDSSTWVPPDRRGVGLVFQDGALWPHMTATQHLRFAAPGMSPDAARALLQQAGLLHLERRKPASFSGGEAQRLGLLRAIAGDPSVLLLDEPLRSVDVHQRDSLVLLLRALAGARGLTTILVTHDRDEALALATDLVVLHQGRVVERGPADALLRAPATAFTAAFLCGAACLPVEPGHNGSVATAFGDLPRPPGAGPVLRLVLLPGDVRAHADTPGDVRPLGTVLSSLPGEHGTSVRVAFGDQIVPAVGAALLPVGARVRLQLQRPPRLLPWDGGPLP